MADMMPNWLSHLEDEEIVFIKKFVLASGSLKELAKQYGVTYPTVRNRVDNIIKKIQVSESDENDSYIALIKRQVINEKLDFDSGKLLINEYKKVKGGL
jgi:Uncharacterized protein conserved in bacteria